MGTSSNPGIIDLQGSGEFEHLLNCREAASRVHRHEKNCPDTSRVRELDTFLESEMKCTSQTRVHVWNPEAVKS